MANERPELIYRNPNILGGVPVFVGTRVPAHILLEYLEVGEPLEEFLDNYPGVSREQAVGLLERAAAALSAYKDNHETREGVDVRGPGLGL